VRANPTSTHRPFWAIFQKFEGYCDVFAKSIEALGPGAAFAAPLSSSDHPERRD